MNIIEKLKKLLGIKQDKLYLPIIEEKQNIAKEFNEKYRVKQLLQIPKEPSLEECIVEFLKQYHLQEKINHDSRHKSYKAFIRMFCDQEEEMRK